MDHAAGVHVVQRFKALAHHVRRVHRRKQFGLVDHVQVRIHVVKHQVNVFVVVSLYNVK